MSALSDLQAQVTATLAVEASAIAAINSLVSQLETAVAQANTAAISSLVSQLAASANTLQATVSSITVSTPNTVVVNTAISSK